MKRLATSLGIVIVLSGPAWAESWVLWGREFDLYVLEKRGGVSQSKSKPVGVHDSKAACLVAAKTEAEAMRQRKIDQQDFLIPDEERADRESKALENGHGYGSTLAFDDPTHSELRHRYFFDAQCWPVGVKPQ